MRNATLRGFLKKEMAQAIRDPRMRIVLFAVPVIQMTLFGLALSNEVRNIKLKFVRQPADSIAEKLEQRCLASGWFVPAQDKTVGSLNDDQALRLLRSGRAHAILIAPPEGFTRSIEDGRGEIQLLVDASNAVRGRSIEFYVQAVMAQVLKEEGRFNAVPPVEFKVRMLYNPSMRTAIFLVPGVMCMMICLITIVLTSMSIAREKEMGTLETLISSPAKIWEIILGKTLPYVIIGMIDVPLVLGVAMLGFGVPMRGNYFELALSAFVFVCASVSLGTLISTFAKNQQQAMMGGFLILFPAIQLSGIMYPLDNIPPLIKWVPYLNPLKYFAILIRNIMLKGGDPAVVWPNMLAMVLLAVVTITISFKRFRHTLN